MDSLLINNAAKPSSRPDPTLEQASKGNPSKFEKVREAAMVQDSSGASEVADASRTSLADPSQSARYAQDRERVGPAHTTAAFGEDLKTSMSSLDQLRTRVSALPNQESLQPLRKQLIDLESEFAKAGQTLDGMKGTPSSQQLLKAQADMFQINEHLSIMSKMVDQITSGVKSILQTQI
jgi:hypothetical protein